MEGIEDKKKIFSDLLTFSQYVCTDQSKLRSYHNGLKIESPFFNQVLIFDFFA